MPKPWVKNLKQWAVLWQVTDQIDDLGRSKVAAPTEIQCRWEEGESNSDDPDTESTTLAGSLMVGVQVHKGSILYLGNLNQYNEAVTAGDPIDYMEVMTVNNTPSIKNRGTCRELGLGKYRSSLPTIAS